MLIGARGARLGLVAEAASWRREEGTGAEVCCGEMLCKRSTCTLRDPQSDLKEVLRQLIVSSIVGGERVRGVDLEEVRGHATLVRPRPAPSPPSRTHPLVDVEMDEAGAQVTAGGSICASSGENSQPAVARSASREGCWKTPPKEEDRDAEQQKKSSDP